MNKVNVMAGICFKYSTCFYWLLSRFFTQCPHSQQKYPCGIYRPWSSCNFGSRPKLMDCSQKGDEHPKDPCWEVSGKVSKNIIAKIIKTYEDIQISLSPSYFIAVYIWIMLDSVNLLVLYYILQMILWSLNWDWNTFSCRFLRENITELLTPERWCHYIRLFSALIWPCGQLDTKETPPLTKEEQAIRKEQARKCLWEFFPGIYHWHLIFELR